MDRNIALEFVRVTEAAALAASRWMGLGNEKKADEAAVTYMRKIFNNIKFEGTVVIGEGERDEAPMLYIGEKIGKGNGVKIDIAVDPLEGTTVTAEGSNNALSVLAAAPHGSFLNAPDIYMDKIAVGPKAKGAISLAKSPEQNIKAVAKKLKKDVADLTVCILKRDRHKDLIARVRKMGVRIKLIGDGDVSGAIATAIDNSGVDLLLGIGGSPEGVIAAAALKCLGGDFQGRLHPRNDADIKRAKKFGILNIDKIYTIDELAKGDKVMFVATGVTDGSLLRGVQYTSFGAKTHSLVMRSASGTIRFIETFHNFDKNPDY
jgi:fructose-1,6-bisphosphatase II